jgi:excinuclease ABC subunit A
VTVDGKRWNGKPLDASVPHDITVTVTDLGTKPTAAAAREVLASADAWGCPEVIVGGRSLLRSPICPSCGTWTPPLEPKAFLLGTGEDTSSHTIGGATLDGVLAMTASEAIAFLESAGVGSGAKRIMSELHRRLAPLDELGLDHLSLDRSMPTLSRGESQRVRLAVVLAGRLEDLLHVLDEPSIGLHRRDVDKLFGVLGELPGPVVMVEHDAAAIANADDVIEIGPGAGRGGGSVTFQGTPARLWKSQTISGRSFSGRDVAVARRAREPGHSFIEIRSARARNLDEIDVRIPAERVTVVTGPSGAGKSTLVRDVLLA